MADTLLLAALALQRNPWRARMYLAAASTVVPAGSLMPFDTIVYDPGSGCTTGSSAKYSCPIDGYYRVTGQGHSPSAPIWGLTILQNNTIVTYGNYTGAAQQRSVAMDTLKCAANDYIQLANQSAAGVTFVGAGAAVNYMVVEWVGPV